MRITTTIFALLLCIAAYGQRPFSNFTEHNGLIFVSGQIGKDTSFQAEVHRTLRNVSAVLKEAGSSLTEVVNVTVYLRSLSQFAEFNSIYVQYFRAPFPARTCVAVVDLVQGADIEISVIAKKGRGVCSP
jgi:2-iminobutanoate/2-iminopropanoate deaminase